MSGFAEFSASCLSCRRPNIERRPGNALNIEIGTPQPRCTPGKIDPALLPKLPTEGAPAHVLPKET